MTLLEVLCWMARWGCEAAAITRFAECPPLTTLMMNQFLQQKNCVDNYPSNGQHAGDAFMAVAMIWWRGSRWGTVMGAALPHTEL